MFPFLLSLFSEGQVFPRGPSRHSLSSHWQETHPRNKLQGGWERLAGVADSLGGAPSHQEVGGCAYLGADLCRHLLTGSSPASLSQHQPCKTLAQEACPPLTCWSVLVYDLPLCRMRRWELLWTGKLGFNAQFWALFCILICMVVCCCCGLVATFVSDSFVTPWTVARQAPPSMGFLRREYWSGLPFPSPGGPLDPGTEPVFPALEGGFFTTEPLGK